MCTDFGHPHLNLRGTPIRWLQTGVYISLGPLVVQLIYLSSQVTMPFRKTVELNTANTIHKVDQALDKSPDNHLRRQKSHDSFFRAVPTHSPSLLGLMSPEFELAPMTTWKHSGASTPRGDDNTPTEIDLSGYQGGIERSMKRTCYSGTGCTVRHHLDSSLLN
jgi:hypothetical protein